MKMSLSVRHSPVRLVAAALMGTLICGCPESGQRIGVDAGRDAALVDGSIDAGTDGAIGDGGSTPDGDTGDASGSDGGNADGGVPDSGAGDAGAGDAGVADAGTSADAGPRVPTCVPGTACGAGDNCATGSTCIVNACGAKVCQPAGSFCGSNAECASGSACATTSIGTICAPTNGEVCNASTDCPPSHACEGAAGSRSCVLRRIPCFDEGECPISYLCLSADGDSQTCQYAYRPCDVPGTCTFTTCSDIDGNGSTECGSGGSCEFNTQCSADDRCVVLAGNSSCGLGGLCNQSGGDACATGWECKDLQGDGYGECVPAGGSCSSHVDCPSGGLCAVPQDRSPPRCTYPL